MKLNRHQGLLLKVNLYIQKMMCHKACFANCSIPFRHKYTVFRNNM